MADIYSEVAARIGSLGYPPTAGDEAAIQYATSRAEWEIKNNTNLPAVPDGLHFVWIDMAAGLFLFDKKATGQLPIQFETPTKSIAEGDTSVAFAVGGSDGALTPEAQYDKMLGSLINPPPEQLAAYRRLRW